MTHTPSYCRCEKPEPAYVEKGKFKMDFCQNCFKPLQPEPYKYKRNQFNGDWLDAGRSAGFTDEQLKFLEDYHYNDIKSLEDLL